VTQHFTRRYQVIRITRTTVTLAGMVLEHHPLRAYDAVQLACALDEPHRCLSYQG
jgi:predicted nucleic acid-binding protein